MGDVLLHCYTGSAATNLENVSDLNIFKLVSDGLKS